MTIEETKIKKRIEALKEEEIKLKKKQSLICSSINTDKLEAEKASKNKIEAEKELSEVNKSLEDSKIAESINKVLEIKALKKLNDTSLLLAEKEKSLKSLTDDYDSLKTDFDKESLRLKSINAEYITKNEELKSSKTKEIDALNATLEEKTKELNKTISNREEHENVIADYKTKEIDLKNRRDTLVSEIKVNEGIKTEVDNIVRNLVDNKNRTEEQVNKIRERALSESKEIETLTNDKEALTNELKTLKTKIEDENNAFIAKKLLMAEREKYNDKKERFLTDKFRLMNETFIPFNK